MSATDLDNKTVIITGAFGNLGVAVARAAAARGANLVLVDRAPAPTDDSLQGLPDSKLVLDGVDLTDLDQAAGMVSSAVEKFGAVDALLNIAGGFCWETFADNDLGNWDFMYTINVKTAVTATKAALPELQKSGGSVVCISAGPALKGDMGLGPYAASKAGVAKFVESLSAEMKDRGVRINGVMPSVIDTPQNREAMPDEDFDRWVKPESLANVVLFLVSEEASAVTGALLPVFNRV